MSAAYLTRVEVRTYWVVIDERGATEMADAGVAVPAADWPSFPARHAEQFASIQAAAAAESPGSAPEEDPDGG